MQDQHGRQDQEDQQDTWKRWADDESCLVEQARKGDRAAFGALVERHQHLVVAYLYHLTGEREASLDLAQETFVRALRAIGERPPAVSVQRWLYRIATNLAYDHFRRQRRFAWVPLYMVDHWISADDTGAVEERELVQRVMQRLKPDERAVLLLCGLERLTYEQAAAVLGGTAEAIRKRFARAKARFRLTYAELAGALVIGVLLP